jgi:hypothetical protein
MTGFIAFPAAHRFLLYCKIYIDVKYSQVSRTGCLSVPVPLPFAGWIADAARQAHIATQHRIT